MSKQELALRMSQFRLLFFKDKVLNSILILIVLIGVYDPAQLIKSIEFVSKSFSGIAPFVLVAAALAAAIKASGADKIVARIFSGNPVKTILIASVFGALSPFCSCGVIPLIASMLGSGVPLGPVMAFWIASPIMDPEMFILTAVGISPQFAIIKSLSAIGMGITAGFSVLLMQRHGFLQDVLKSIPASGCATNSFVSCQNATIEWSFWKNKNRKQIFMNEALTILLFLCKWLILAFVIESLMVAFIEPTWVQKWTSGDSLTIIPLAALIGMPSYLNGYAAIPLVSGLMDMGMSSGAALAFMIAGAVSSIPAAIAVYALVKKQVFMLYLAIGFLGSIVSGGLYGLAF